MDLHSNFPYWLLKNGIINNYPSIQENEKCDVAIIGAGISGALVAWYLGKAGIKQSLLISAMQAQVVLLLVLHCYNMKLMFPYMN
jgi:alkyl hydroperoxide reductase subunit AhpF